jgi:hypothetical protein
MSVPTSCASCGRELYTNPPIRDIKCKQCQEIERLEKFIDNLHVTHFTELQREKATVEQYEKILKEIVSYTKYKGNNWYEKAQKALEEESKMDSYEKLEKQYKELKEKQAHKMTNEEDLIAEINKFMSYRGLTYDDSIVALIDALSEESKEK